MKSKRALREVSAGIIFIGVSLLCFGGAFLTMRFPNMRLPSQKTHLPNTPTASMPNLVSATNVSAGLKGEKSGLMEVRNTIRLCLVTLGKEDGLELGDILDVYSKTGRKIGEVKVSNLYDSGADAVPVPATLKYHDGFYRVIWRSKKAPKR